MQYFLVCYVPDTGEQYILEAKTLEVLEIVLVGEHSDNISFVIEGVERSKDYYLKG